jgi:hypothetical protein
MDFTLDNLLQLDPADTRSAQTPVSQAADIIQAEVIDVPDVVSPSGPAKVTPPPVDPHTADLNDDVAFARQQIQELVKDGRSAINGAMELATAGSEARPYEVVGGLITATVTAAKELVNLHKIRKDTIKSDKEATAAENSGAMSSPTIHIDKAVFAGRASDLLRELQQVKKDTAARLAAESDVNASES